MTPQPKVPAWKVAREAEATARANWYAMDSADRERLLAKQVKELAIAVALLLGLGWDVAKRDFSTTDRFYLTGPGGEHIDLDIAPATRDKLHISGTIPNRNPETKWGEGAGVSIQVAHSRGAVVIAKEIKRRFLPDYQKALAERIEQNRAKANHEAKRTAVARRVMEAFGETPTIEALKGDTHRINSYREEGSHYPAGYGHVQVYADSSVNIKLDSVPVAMALEIAAIFRKFKGVK